MQFAAVTSTARNKQKRKVKWAKAQEKKEKTKIANKNKKTEKMNEYLTYSRDISA